jgi:hypothetical protein
MEDPKQEKLGETGNVREEHLTTASLAGTPEPGARAPETRSFATDNDTSATPLFGQDESADLKSRWDQIQAGFIDEPRRAVQQADALVASAMKRLAEMFADERSKLEGQWDRGGDVSTEDLRLALRRYRSFFERLLSI